jgi:hypothetical protein
MSGVISFLSNTIWLSERRVCCRISLTSSFGLSSSEYSGALCHRRQGGELSPSSSSFLSGGGDGEGSLTLRPPVGGNRGGARGVASATFYITSSTVDGRLVILVFTFAMLLASGPSAFESLATCSANSLIHAYHSTSLAKRAFWTFLHFLLQIPLAVFSALALKTKD